MKLAGASKIPRYVDSGQPNGSILKKIALSGPQHAKIRFGKDGLVVTDTTIRHRKSGTAIMISQIARWILNSHMTVAFTGAGISTESGIPDFRSPGGVWSKYRTIYFQEFIADREARYEYWRQKSEGHRDFSEAKPNVGHKFLADMEASDRLHSVITQNIDGLHQIAGNRRVLELHGTARQIACLSCDYRSDAQLLVDQFLAENNVPNCPACGGLLKHATVSFGQDLPTQVLETAVAWCKESDLLITLGSSLVVTPAADLPKIAKHHGAKLVIINRDETPLDGIADAVVRTSIGSAATQIADHLDRMNRG